MKNETGNAVVPKADKPMEFTPFAARDAIKLSVRIVQELIAVPTKSGKTCTERDAMRFMMMCQAKRMNPFEGDAFLIGFDSNAGPQFNMITAHQTYLKRAEVNPEFDGMTSGVIVDEEGELKELEGDFHTSSQKVVGGWARVFFKNRKIPVLRRLRLERFKKSFGVWVDDPAGMICKCAEADALRSAFPTMLGGLYMQQEIDAGSAIDIPHIPEAARRIVDAEETAQETKEEKPQDSAGTQAKPATGSDKGAGTKGAKKSAKAEFAETMENHGILIGTVQKWGSDTGNIENADSLGSFDEIPEEVCARLIRSKGPLVLELKKRQLNN